MQLYVCVQRLNVFGKCLLVIYVRGPMFWCVVCLRASVESLFLAVLFALISGEPGKCVPTRECLLWYILVHCGVNCVFKVIPVGREWSRVRVSREEVSTEYR